MKRDRPVLPFAARVDSHHAFPGTILVGSEPMHDARGYHETPHGRHSTRTTIMRPFRLLLAFAFLLGSAGCLSDPGPVGTGGNTTGTFVLTIDEFASGPTSGAAQFQL